MYQYYIKLCNDNTQEVRRDNDADNSTETDMVR